MAWFLPALALLVLARPAAANPCGDADELLAVAFRTQVSAEQRTCLESTMADGTDPTVRASNSFVLIIDAYVRGDLTRYGQLLDTHLTRYHTTDPEVAYLYANHLWKEHGASDEVIKWARVAMENRRRWLKNRANYDKMVKGLWDLLVEVSMVRAVEVAEEYGKNPTPDNEKRLQHYRRQARYYLVVAAPCLHYGDCGPYFEVEVEGWEPCDDLVALEARARRGMITQDQQACLRSKYRKPQAPKPRILDILADQADAETLARLQAGRDEANAWEQLLTWHYNATGIEDPTLATRYAEFLLAHDEDGNQEALRWAETAMQRQDELKGRSGRATYLRLLLLRVESAKRVHAEAAERAKRDPSALNDQLLEQSRHQLAEAERSHEVYCGENPEACAK